MAMVASPPPTAQSAALAMQMQIAQNAVPLSERQVCSLLSKSTGNGASIAGQDGGVSVAVDGTTYWTFSDTVLTSPPNSFIPNNAGTSTDTDASNCIDITHDASGGVANTLMPAGAFPDESTVWPGGMVATATDRAYFFYASISNTPPPFSTRFLGLARFDLSALAVTRLGPDPAKGQPFWDPALGIAGAEPVLSGGWVYIFVNTPSGLEARLRLARVAPEDIEDVSRYQYWDAASAAFTPEFTRSSVLMSGTLAMLTSPVSWNPWLNRWTITYTAGWGSRIEMRTAPALTGPWTQPKTILDCRGIYAGPGPLGGYCYGAREQQQYQRDGGRTAYFTVASEIDYRLFLHEVTFASPVRQYTVAGVSSYARDGASPPPAPDDGIAFYAGDRPGAGLAAIHEWRGTNGEVQYAAVPPTVGATDGGIAFYAPLSATVSERPATSTLANLTRRAYEPVYRWDQVDNPSVHRYSQFASVPGFSRGPVAFYAPCPDTDGDGANDCVESAQGTDRLNVDTDGDGHADLAPPNDQLVAPWDLRFDNCPTVANPDQGNADADFINLITYGKPFNDITVPNSDSLGDVCDADADNDGIPNVRERLLPDGDCPSASGPTNELAIDTDGDGVTDSAECLLGTDPTDAYSVPSKSPPADSDLDGLPDAVERRIGTDPFRADTDGDGVNDGIEVMTFATNPLAADTDGDGCSDRREIASVNGDRGVNSVDLLYVVKSFGSHRSGTYVPDMDMNRDGWVNVIDLLFNAKAWGSCRS
ncbi:MAG: DUF4185 domain-containing protein [Chloroflexi bacterium]|nr:DUF4185 domain-containing protein [Chloroflexota bacterium]